MKFFGYWTVFVALCISVVAAYYSIVGLVAIFAAAAIPVIIMGSVLEVGKLTTAVWLHLNGKNAGFLIRSYLTAATILLMFITSMGIFGFLSKAHIEQTAVATEGVAQLERIETEIARNEAVIARAEDKIQKLESSGADSDSAIQQQIAQEQQRIDSAYDSISPAVNDQQAIIDRELRLAEEAMAPYTAELADIDQNLALITEYISTDQIRRLQGLIGARQDGQYGSNTAAKVEEYRAGLEARRTEILEIMNSMRSSDNPAIENARAEIARLRSIAEQQITSGNELISRLRTQLGSTDTVSIQQEVNAQREVIREANNTLDTLITAKYDIEAEARKLEAEVGPVKYIAELVYGNQADGNTLEAAVRWVILILVAVFDPLAVVLVISGISIIEHYSRKKEPADNTLADNTGQKLFTEEQVEEYIQEAIQILKSENVEKEPELNTDSKDAKDDVIVYQGVEYSPTHYDYKRISEQIELNNQLRRERQGIIKNPVDRDQE